LARALFKRASAYHSLRQTAAAVRDYKRAAHIWKDLHEDEPSAEAEWHAIVLEDDLPLRLLKRLEKEQYLTRVNGVRLLRQEMEASKSSSRGRRIDPSDIYLNDLVKRAKQQAALQLISWS
jgi:hypothetical protein